MEDVFQNGNYCNEANANMSTSEASKEDSLLDHMEILIVEAEKRPNGPLNLREFYTVYLIETKVTDLTFKGALSITSSLWRRYTDFELLRTYLDIAYPYIVLPPLPEKRVLYAWQKVTTDTFDPDFVDRRRAGLENFLLRVASHPVLSQNEHFMGFLQQREGWREHIQEISYLRLAESKLKALSVAVRLRKPDKRFETLKNYGIELQNNLCNLLRVRARLVEKQYSLYKLHANYGRVFSEWSAIEKEMGDGLQKSGHYLDSLAATIDTTLEEEELIADQLKEWLFGASALQAVVRRREALQVARDEAQDALIAACEQKDRVIQGKSGLMSRLFGSVDTEEVRELKILRLEHRITQQNEMVKQVDEDLKSFSSKAMVDIERFQHQKVVDLKETLAAYCVLQFKLARKSLQTWQHIKECLESIPFCTWSVPCSRGAKGFS
ncbi:PREDICTED: sorting nexin-4-like isoform X1 [Polistes canadensis]|uniref:sorting nexin-4-like isoform X1 n=2 Tax=Polistes canadensis TaxID=91411 RepID=UPI000718F1EE|nr:PREDICTED: sorting nexin-4-like isoform X1 [Polistes canadensis]